MFIFFYIYEELLYGTIFGTELFIGAFEFLANKEQEMKNKTIHSLFHSIDSTVRFS